MNNIKKLRLLKSDKLSEVRGLTHDQFYELNKFSLVLSIIMHIVVQSFKD